MLVTPQCLNEILNLSNILKNLKKSRQGDIKLKLTQLSDNKYENTKENCPGCSRAMTGKPSQFINISLFADIFSSGPSTTKKVP